MQASIVTLDSLPSGFNIGASLSREELLSKLMGFTPEEVVDLLSNSGAPSRQMEEVMQDLRDWYNGYRFATQTLYPPDLGLYFLSAYQRCVPWPVTTTTNPCSPWWPTPSHSFPPSIGSTSTRPASRPGPCPGPT